MVGGNFEENEGAIFMDNRHLLVERFDAVIGNDGFSQAYRVQASHLV